VKNILITGALGHIGSSIISNLQKNQFKKIVLIDNFLTQRYSSLFFLSKKNNIKFYEYSILDKNIEKLFNDIDVVVHLAAITDAANSFNKKTIIKKVNFDGTKKIIEYCSKHNCKLIFPSTTSVYGTQNKQVDENCTIEELKPQSPYAEYKLKSELYLKKFSNMNKLNYVILRFGTIFGFSKGMRFHTAVNKFCFQASLNQPLTIWETAMNQKRPYLGVQDAVKCINFIINKDIFDNQIYNIVSDNCTVSEIINIIKSYKKNIKINLVKTRIMNQLSYKVLSKKILKKGFKSKSNINLGIKETINLLQGVNNA
jgi:nucleoside-diphosphate-sugar epimerase